MIKYPNGQRVKSVSSTQQKTVDYAHRGMRFEDEINKSNEAYREKDIAIIYKKPTPIKVVNAGKTITGSYKIDEAYFMEPSTTDYNGIYRGKYIDFEAKETRNVNLFPLGNIHDHQLEHLFAIEAHGGISFIIVSFRLKDEIYLFPASEIKKVLEQKKRSIPYETFKEKGIRVPLGYQIPVDYLKAVDSYFFK